MSFLFTFSFSVPGLRNPFSAASQPRTDDAVHLPCQAHASASAPASLPTPHISRKDPPPPPRRPSPPSTSSPPPLSRKRGWEPSNSSPSTAATAASTGVYLDTPAKHHAMADSQQEVDQEPVLDELPSTKRRRTLTGTIVSTAVSAALIGTAVGLTVYRLWRDRGKEFTIEAPTMEEQEEDRDSHEDDSYMGPPPPYHAEDYHTRSQPPTVPASPKAHRRPNTAHHISTLKRPANIQRRRAAVAARQQASAHSRNQSSYLASPPRPEFDFNSQHLGGETDDAMDVEGEAAEEEAQLDKLGAQLEALISAGRAALRSHVVVASEDPQDAVDDGRGDWVEVEDPAAGPSSLRHARSGSFRRARSGSATAIGPSGSLKRQKRPREIHPPPEYSTFNQNYSTPTLGGPAAGPSSSYGMPSPVSSPQSRTFADSQPGNSVSGLGGAHAPFATPSRSAATTGLGGSSSSYGAGFGDSFGMGASVNVESFHAPSLSVSTPIAGRQDTDSWASPELRASMERARARYRR